MYSILLLATVAGLTTAVPVNTLTKVYSGEIARQPANTGTIILAGGRSSDSDVARRSTFALIFAEGGVVNSFPTPPRTYLIQGRHGAAVGVRGDDLVVAGGRLADGQPTASSEFTVEEDRQFQPGSDMGRARQGAAFANLGNYLYVCGGSATDATSCERYEYATRTWQATPSMPAGVNNAWAVSDKQSRMWLVGGSDPAAPSGQDELNTLYLFDAAAGTWTQKASMRARRSSPRAVLRGNNEIVVCGGSLDEFGFNPHTSSCERYDIAADSWSTFASMTERRSGHGMAVVEGQIYAYGGQSARDAFASSIERYDDAGGRWATVGQLPEALADFSAAQVSPQ